ncbi:hypothetical protein [Treponema sp.]|uniref:hypothetical protein n=1 Tax=Treponema sp. TaxID=166 RepID=UPI00388EE993
MRIKRSSLKVCAMVFGAVISLFICSGLVGCKINDAENEKIVLFGSINVLEANDPICGTWIGNAGYFVIEKNCFYNAMVSNCDAMSKPSENPICPEGYKEYGYEPWNTYHYLSKTNYSKIYVVYNDKDKKSGVLIFKALLSQYGSPTKNCYYGVKFELKSGSSALFEGGYNNALNDVSDLADAIEKFGFNNNDYFAPASWTEARSGVTKQ